MARVSVQVNSGHLVVWQPLRRLIWTWSRHNAMVQSDPPSDAASPEEPPDRGETLDESAAVPDRPAYRSLYNFAALQRQLAAVDLAALRAAQRSIGQPDSIRRALKASAAAARAVTESVDFAGLGAAFKVLTESGAASRAMVAQQQWADSLARAIDPTVLDNTLAGSAHVESMARINDAILSSLGKQTELFARISETFASTLPKVDLSGLKAALDRWIPSNLRGVGALDAVATIALEEGIPLSWVPRQETVLLLIEAYGPDDRVQILRDCQEDVLDDCEAALDPISHEWAVQCRSAIAALRAGLDGPAQSHASNIIDSIVLGLHGRTGREHAKRQAQEDLDGMPLQLAAENLTLRPLFRAFVRWFPNTGVDPPDHFARHVTSHAVGHEGVFGPLPALVAVMLATSLTVQYVPVDAAGDASDRDEAR